MTHISYHGAVFDGRLGAASMVFRLPGLRQPGHDDEQAAAEAVQQ